MESVYYNIPQKRPDNWQLMHSPTSEIWIRWSFEYLVKLQQGTERHFVEENEMENELVGLPIQIGSDDEDGSGFNRGRPEVEAAAQKGEARVIRPGLRPGNGLRHMCLKAGEYVRLSGSTLPTGNAHPCAIDSSPARAVEQTAGRAKSDSSQSRSNTRTNRK